MKKALSILVFASLFLLASTAGDAFGQPNPSNQSNGSTAGGAPIAGAGAPVGSGEFLLLTLAAMYGYRKTSCFKHTQPKQI